MKSPNAKVLRRRIISKKIAGPATEPNRDALSHLANSIRRRELVVIIGTGVSMSLTDAKVPALSWKGLIEDGFSFCLKKGRISPAQAKAWKLQLASNDIDDLLAAAEFMSRKLEAPSGSLYSRWLEKVFSTVRATNQAMVEAIIALQEAQIPICTLNYDSLLEQTTGLPAINVNETVKVAGWMRRERPGILHLHGTWDVPTACIVGIRDYETTLGNDIRDLIQRSLGSFSRLLFIGCGDTFADPNFTALIRWLREKMKTAAPQHYALIKADEVARRNADATWHGFVEPLSYGLRHTELPEFLLKNFQTQPLLGAQTNTSARSLAATSLEQQTVLDNYRAFLVKDCGQMTIEGVRADMDTAQRRFDLERLFVPLSVLPCPPEIPDTDPQRAEKLQKWHEKNKEGHKFGEVFTKHKRLALLALPGGGKTLLLKRLAVAYADRTRRRASDDALPELDLTPVLIRCREWRDQIHRPILTLLQNVADITGHAPIKGLSDALLPLFENGRVLLLVDGLDEIHDDALRSTFVEHLEAFLDQYKLTRLVVTSREAGFNLVAPVIARFCERWRVAPLEPEAITLLCRHWHMLMKGDSPDAKLESDDVSSHLIHNHSLRRLAENPLLLTMLLVVKHGAGRLPPDRVSLYSRAVEVLLDTWNIKGHDPLNPKEAVPQLAFIAFELMVAGKQTATEKELLRLLDQAREYVPQIRRYAKDSPHEFLKRVELRSSLLVEAGHQTEDGRTVPFYQFRHLTFQEYLAAVAAVEGHYIAYKKGDTVEAPLAKYLIAEEWKEVIPMAAVLARKQGEPLMTALVAEGNLLRRTIESGGKLHSPGEHRERLPLTLAEPLPAPVARLLQCLVEEAEAAPETLTSALQLIAFFAKGCMSRDDWRALMRGPYGNELLHQAWLMYAPMKWPKEILLLNTCARLAAYRYSPVHWDKASSVAELKISISSDSEEELTRGLFTFAGLVWDRIGHEGAAKGEGTLEKLIPDVERAFFHSDPAIWVAATWGWALIKYHGKRIPPPSAVLDHLLSIWLHDSNIFFSERAAIALFTQLGLPRDAWAPTLNDPQVARVKELAALHKKSEDHHENYFLAASIVVAFHSRNIWSDAEIAQKLTEIADHSVPMHPRRDPLDSMLHELGAAGEELLAKRRALRQRETKSATGAS